MGLGCHKSGRGEAEQKGRLHPHQEGTRKYREIECGLLEGRLDALSGTQASQYLK